MRWVCYGLIIINVAFFAWQALLVNDESLMRGAKEVLPEGVASIRLLNELGDQADMQLEVRADAQACDVYGPFFSDLEAKAFLRAVNAFDLIGVAVEEQVRLKPYYRLYIKAQGERQKALALINRLRGYQLNAELFSEGDLRWSISLGDFETADEVARLRKKLLIHGIEVEVLEKSRDYQQFWVYLNPGSAAHLIGSLQEELIEKFPDIFHQQKNCKPVASGE